MKREGRRRGVYILPSILTIGNLFCGFYAIIAVSKHDYSKAALAIMIALVVDFLDGAVARIAKATSDFGVELDSLADLVSFGVAPGMLAYVFAMRPFGRIGWLAAFLFAACGALRLARFNVQTRKLDKRHFVGLPIPAAAASSPRPSSFSAMSPRSRSSRCRSFRRRSPRSSSWFWSRPPPFSW